MDGYSQSSYENMEVRIKSGSEVEKEVGYMHAWMNSLLGFIHSAIRRVIGKW